MEGKEEILVRVIPDRGELAAGCSAPGGSSRRNAMRWPNWSKNALQRAEPMRYLLDTSALLAHHRQERGWEMVQAILKP